MSRTDKDRPWRIRAEDRIGKYNGAYYYHDSWNHLRHGGCGEYCGWTLPHCTFRGTPRWFRHEIWDGPERGRERDELRGYAREFNAGHRPYDGVGEDPEYDFDFPNYQHRHMGHWLWC